MRPQCLRLIKIQYLCNEIRMLETPIDHSPHRVLSEPDLPLVPVVIVITVLQGVLLFPAEDKKREEKELKVQI